MFRTGRFVIVACLLSCGNASTAPAQPSPDPGVTDSLFVIATPEVTREPLSARFSAALPSSLSELHAEAYPPRPFISAALAADAFDMRRRFADAVTRAATAGPIPDALFDWYVDQVGFSPDLATCQWLVEMALRPLPDAARAVFWDRVVSCEDRSLASTLERDEVPDHVVIGWYARLLTEVPFRERVTRAASAIAAGAPTEIQLEELGFVFAKMRGEEAVAALAALQRSLHDPKHRALLGVGMLQSSSPAGRALGEHACQHPELASRRICKPEDPLYEQEYGTSVAGLIERDEDAATLLAKFPRAEVVEALTHCAQFVPGYRQRCFQLLADADRGAALALARSLGSSDDPQVARMARMLLRFPKVSDLEHELERLGVTLAPSGRAPKFPREPLTAEDLLIARGRGSWFDTETSTVPVEHDELLMDLARLAAPALDGVVFEEIAPSLDDLRGPYRLHAYADGKRYAISAENHGDWYDVPAVVGLLNALLVARGSDLRLFVLSTGDQSVKVIAGPRTGIRALLAAGLIQAGDVAAPQRMGHELERRVFDVLKTREQRDP